MAKKDFNISLNSFGSDTAKAFINEVSNKPKKAEKQPKKDNKTSETTAEPTAEPKAEVNEPDQAEPTATKKTRQPNTDKTRISKYLESANDLPMFYSMPEVEKILNVSRQTLWKLRRDGLITTITQGRKKVITQEELLRFLNGNR